jgi:hypothetical protein
MHLTKSEIFWKCWLWSTICGATVAIIVATVMSIAPHWLDGGGFFFELVMLFGIGGTYFGAGYVGWRIADKYKHDRENVFRKRYIQYSIVTFLLLVAVSYSPLAILGLLWSFIAPTCVLQALAYAKKVSRA